MWDLHPTPGHTPPSLTIGSKLCPTLPSSAHASALTSSAGVAQGAADFILVQVGVWDHQDVGASAQGAVIRSLAPHFLSGQCTTGNGRAGGDVTGAGTLSTVTIPFSHRPDRRGTSYHQVRDTALPIVKTIKPRHQPKLLEKPINKSPQQDL